MNNRPTTVKELRELLAQFPDNTPIYSVSQSGVWACRVKVELERVGKSSTTPKKIVSRGGVESILFL